MAGSCVIGCPANTVRTISGHVTPISGLVSNACELSADRCRVNEPAIVEHSTCHGVSQRHTIAKAIRWRPDTHHSEGKSMEHWNIDRWHM